MFDKIWAAHEVLTREDGETLLYVDRHFIHEGSMHAFARLRELGLKLARPLQTVGTADHYVPTSTRELTKIADSEIRRMIELFARNTAEHGIEAFGLEDQRQGIVHVVGPERGITLPGMVIVCGDSHTSTHGALGALAFGIGASEVAHVMATQTLWQRRPRTMRITVDGRLGPGVGAKDLILGIIAAIGTGGAVQHVIEYAGLAIRQLSVEGRLTLCNMSIEAGARAGMVAPDEATLEYLAGRPEAPQGAEFERALADWRGLPSDEEARFDREVSLDAGALAPMVTWGTTPETALPIGGAVPDPAGEGDADRRRAMQDMLEYMGLVPGTPMTGIKVDRVFIGSCTNSRIEDLRAAATIAGRGRAAVPVLVSPGSTQVRRQAEQEGLDRIFRAAGFEWGHSGCSMCVAMNGDRVAPGERCASTSNRNFQGRQGRGARTHLMGPTMAAATALAGRIADPRPYL
jgi:3-isopropylmalate/(R)-2-methylmalate dehydratase large subunit